MGPSVHPIDVEIRVPKEGVDDYPLALGWDAAASPKPRAAPPQLSAPQRY
ncbi:MAG: hypothetical protein ACJA2W_001952 [Planctomycetota bacterium]|jgi:hypothetical protein